MRGSLISSAGHRARRAGAGTPFPFLLSPLAALALVLCLHASALAFGAIAVDDEAGLDPVDVGWGFSTGHDTPAEAALFALDQCRKAGNGECRVAARFEACGAYVVSHSRFDVGWGPTKQDALFMALNGCGPDCRVVVAECE